MSAGTRKDRYLPSCWTDDVRMNAMFSAFRSKDLNPTGWQEKMNFWVNLIGDYCRETRRISVSLSDVKSAFERNKRHPNCLAEVFDYMYSENMVVSTGQFKHHDGNNSWLWWSYSLLKKPVTQSFSLVKNMFFVPQKEEERFVVLGILRDVANRLFEKLLEFAEGDDIVAVEDFKTHPDVSAICNINDFNLVIVQLQKEKKVMVIKEGEYEFLKLKKEDESPLSPPTTADMAMVQLRKTIDTVYKEMDVLENEIADCIQKAKQLVKFGNRSKAMTYLKRKKRLEVELKKKIQSVDNLELLLIQLKNCGSEKLVLQAYNAGVDAMKTNLKSDLDLDKVDRVMGDLEEAIDDVAEVGRTLSRAVISDDLAEFEEELEELLSEESEVSKEPEAVGDHLAEATSDDELLRRLAALREPPTAIPRASTSAVRS